MARLPWLALAISAALACGGPQSESEPEHLQEGNPPHDDLTADMREQMEREECERGLRNLEELFSRSAGASCASDEECATVTHPGHPSEERRLAVHHEDAEELDMLARAFIDRCGPLLHHVAHEEAFDVVEAICREQRCVSETTTFHPEPVE